MASTAAQRMSTAISALRQVDPEIPMSIIVVLLALADGEEQEVRDLQQSTGLSASALNRALTTLGAQHFSKGKEGYYLVNQYISPADRRVRIAQLSPRGRQLINTIEGILK